MFKEIFQALPTIGEDLERPYSILLYNHSLVYLSLLDSLDQISSGEALLIKHMIEQYRVIHG